MGIDDIRLHPKQFEVFNDKARFKVAACGRRWGKSFLSQVSLLDRAVEKSESLNWYIAPSYKMAKQIMWDPMNSLIPKKWIVKRHETAMRFELINCSVIELKGADKPDSLRGVGLHYVILDEMQDIKPGVWNAIVRPTLTTTKGDALFIGTSKAKNHFYDLYKKGLEDTTGMWRSWQFPTISSPFVPTEEVERAKSDMDEKTFRMEYECSFEDMAGKVYYPFDRALHVGEYKFNPKLPILIGQDFNIDPMSSAIIQPQPNGELWVVDEIVLYSSNTQEVCEEIERKYWRNLANIVMYPDPAGGARQHARGETDLDIFREKGFKKIKYRKKHPKITDRVNSVNKMLMSAKGEVTLKVDRSCKHLIKSFEQTMYLPGGREIDKDMGVEHISDALGYCIEYEYPIRKVYITGVSI